MPSLFFPFTPRRLKKFSDPADEGRIAAIEWWIQQASQLSRVQVDPRTGQVVATTGGSGGGGNGGGTPTATNLAGLNQGASVVNPVTAINAGAGLTGAADGTNDGQFDLTANGVSVEANGAAAVGPELTVNLIPGTNMTSVTAADNPGAGRVDVTFNAATQAGTPHPLLDGVQNNDTTNSTPVAGDLITANGSNLWTRFAIGSANRVLKVVAGAVSWAQVAFSELTGSLSGSQHGVLDSSSGADHTGTLSANARTGVKSNGGATVGPRRTLNFVPGTNVTSITATDDSANEKVDITVNVPTGAGGGTGPLLDASHNSDTTAHTPVKGDMIYANATPAWAALAIGTTPADVLGFSSGVPAWIEPTDALIHFTRGDITTVTTSLQQMPRPIAGKTAGVQMGVQMLRAGYVVAVAILLSGDIGSSGEYDVEVKKAANISGNSFGAFGSFGTAITTGVLGGIGSVHDHGATSYAVSANTAFAAYDQLAAFDKYTTLPANAQSAEVTVWVRFSGPQGT